MGKHSARVIDVQHQPDALREIIGIGASPVAAKWMADEATMRVVRLENVSGRAATILKQDALAMGAECAVAHSVAAFDDAPQSIVLIANLKQHKALARKLRAQPFGLTRLGEEVMAAVEAYDSRGPAPLPLGRHTLPLGKRTLIMGIINATPDSFSGDGVDVDVEAAVTQAGRFVDEGADVLDVGGQSTRPGSAEVSADEEIARVVPVVERLAAEVDAPVSVDTDKAPVAEAALDAGAGMVNDVRALRAGGMLELVAERKVPVCVMHMLGTPRTMQEAPKYDDVIADVYRFLEERALACVEVGLPRESVIIDPGFGFGKTAQHNLTILRRLREFRSLGCPVLIGTSRKSTIGAVLDLPAEERVEGTAATCAVAIRNGADIIRVHDVREMARVARMTDAIVRGLDGE